MVAAAVAPLREVVAAEVAGVAAVRPARPARVEEVAVVAELRAHLASVAAEEEGARLAQEGVRLAQVEGVAALDTRHCPPAQS